MEIEKIKNKIHNIRDKQVMLDRDLAELYQVKSIRLREQVKRNIDRFPTNFCFQLTYSEIDFLVSQNAIPSKKHLGGSLPYVFTEQGVSMLSAVLNSKKAIEISIQIINAFVEMKRFISQNQDVFKRLNIVETKLLEHDNNFNKIFELLENQTPKKGIFFEGQLFDAHTFISDLIRQAKTQIKLIDNYIDDRTLKILNKRNKNVNVTIYTKKITKNLKQDIKKYNSQYEPIEIKPFNLSHDRFLIIDDEIYHIGASLKDAGKTWFAFSKMNSEIYNLITKNIE